MKNWTDRYGPWALVTGASDGIGLAIAKNLAARGQNLVLVARRKDALIAIAAEIATQYKVRALVLSVDLGEPAAIEKLIKDTNDLDIGLLVAAAGFGTAGQVLTSQLADELNMIDVNVRAVFHLTRLFAPKLVTRGGGGVVLFSSIVAFQGVPNTANYAATKAYVQTLAEGLRLELKARNVDVLSCAPGPVNTGFAARSGLSMGAALDPRDVADETLNALGRKATVRPGFLSKLLIWSLAILPRRLRSVVLGQIMGGMVKQKNGSAT